MYKPYKKPYRPYAKKAPKPAAKKDDKKPKHKSTPQPSITRSNTIPSIKEGVRTAVRFYVPASDHDSFEIIWRNVMDGVNAAFKSDPKLFEHYVQLTPEHANTNQVGPITIGLLKRTDWARHLMEMP